MRCSTRSRVHADPLRKAREESLRTIATMCGLLGYSEEWAVELEERAFRAGKLWHESSVSWRQV